MRRTAAGPGLQAGRRGPWRRRGGWRRPRGPSWAGGGGVPAVRPSALIGAEGPTPCRPVVARAGLWERLGSSSVDWVVGFGRPSGKGGSGPDVGSARCSRPPGPWPAGLRAPGFEHRPRQTRASGFCPSALVFLKKRQLLPKEKSHICLRMVIGLSCNFIREGAVGHLALSFLPFFFVSFGGAGGGDSRDEPIRTEE